MKINRRKFIGGAAAATASALFMLPSLGSAQFNLQGTQTGRLTSKRLIPYNLKPYQLRIWAALMRGEKVIYATGSPENAQHVYDVLQRHKNLHCTHIGGPLMGRRADYIILDDYKDRENSPSSTIREHFRDWNNCCLRTRLTPGGLFTQITT